MLTRPIVCFMVVFILGCGPRSGKQPEQTGACSAQTDTDLMSTRGVVETVAGVRLRLPSSNALVHTVSANCKVASFGLALVRMKTGGFTTAPAGSGDLYVHAESREGGYRDGGNPSRCTRRPPFVDLADIGVRACLPMNQNFMTPKEFASAIANAAPVPSGLDYEIVEDPKFGLRHYASISCPVVAGSYIPSSLSQVQLRTDSLCRIYWVWRSEVYLLVDVEHLAKDGVIPLSEIRPALISLQQSLDSWVDGNP